jgi:hypothetical protein
MNSFGGTVSPAAVLHMPITKTFAQEGHSADAAARPGIEAFVATISAATVLNCFGEVEEELPEYFAENLPEKLPQLLQYAIPKQ